MRINSNVLFAVGALVGCAAGAAVVGGAQGFPSNPAAPKWQQFCHRQKGAGVVNDVNDEAAKLGADGWEMFAVSVDQAWGIAVCYKRPAP